MLITQSGEDDPALKHDFVTLRHVRCHEIRKVLM